MEDAVNGTAVASVKNKRMRTACWNGNHDQPSEIKIEKAHSDLVMYVRTLLTTCEKRCMNPDYVCDNVLCQLVSDLSCESRWAMGRLVTTRGKIKWRTDILDQEFIKARPAWDDISIWRPPADPRDADATFYRKDKVEYQFVWRMDSRATRPELLSPEIEFEYVVGKALTLAHNVIFHSIETKSFPFYDNAELVSVDMMEFNIKMIAVVCCRIAFKFCIGDCNKVENYCKQINLTGIPKRVFLTWEGRVLELLEWNIGAAESPTFVDRVLKHFDTTFGIFHADISCELAFLHSPRFADMCREAETGLNVKFTANRKDHTDKIIESARTVAYIFKNSLQNLPIGN